jgi:hypothetical protein
MHLNGGALLTMRYCVALAALMSLLAGQSSSDVSTGSDHAATSLHLHSSHDGISDDEHDDIETHERGVRAVASPTPLATHHIGHRHRSLEPDDNTTDCSAWGCTCQGMRDLHGVRAVGKRKPVWTSPPSVAAKRWFWGHKCSLLQPPPRHGAVFDWPTFGHTHPEAAYATLVLAEGCNSVTLERLGALLASLQSVHSRAPVYVMTDAERGSLVHDKLSRVANAFGATIALVPSINGERDRETLLQNSFVPACNPRLHNLVSCVGCLPCRRTRRHMHTVHSRVTLDCLQSSLSLPLLTRALLVNPNRTSIPTP